MTKANALYVTQVALDGIEESCKEEGYRVGEPGWHDIQVFDPDANERFFIEVRVFEVTGGEV